MSAWTKTALAAIAGISGLVLGVLLIEHLGPAPLDAGYPDLSAQRPTCEVLFVGPSFVKDQIVTKVVDQAAEAAGRPLRSCKFARTNLKAFELERELERVLSEPWPKLRLVMLDVTLGADTSFKPENRYKARVLRWHTWGFLPWYLDHLAGQRDSPRARKRRIFEHLGHVVVNALLVGRGAEILATLGPAAPAKPRSVERLSRKKLEALHRKDLSKLLKGRKRGTSKDAAALGAWVGELRELVRGHGFEADALIAPVWDARFVGLSAFPRGDRPVVHEFDDPRAYPALYEVGAHNMTGHLTPEASREYSMLLGRRLAARLEEIE